MFSVNDVLRRLREDEGFRSAPYQCSKGVWTIGYGNTYLDNQPVTADTPPMSISEARVHLKADVLDAVEDCQAIYGDLFGVLHSVHQEILICMAYQLGRSGLQAFQNMNQAIREFDYEGWKRELQDSVLFIKHRKRITRYLNAIDSGQWDW